MTTATEEEVQTPMDPNTADADAFEREGLDAPEGNYRFTLVGVYGLGKTNNGKHYLSARFALDQRAEYDSEGNLTEITDLSQRPYHIFHKFWIESGYGNAQLGSWLSCTTGTPKGEFNPATDRYEFQKDAALAASVDQSAWNRIRHQKDDEYGWDIDIQREFRKKAPNRIKVD